VLWLIVVYLLIGVMLYNCACDMMEEQDPKSMFGSFNRVQLLPLVFLWLPMMIYGIFKE
jgi:hypothetical protein